MARSSDRSIDALADREPTAAYFEELRAMYRELGEELIGMQKKMRAADRETLDVQIGVLHVAAKSADLLAGRLGKQERP